MRILTLLLILLLSFSFIAENGKQACVDQSIIDPNANCLFIYEPVCGCNGNSYPNECTAVKFNGISQMLQGPCGCNYNWNNMPPCFSCFSRVEIIQYNNNNYIAEWGDNVNCSDALTTLYNCDGTVFCMQGGIAGINTCGNLDDNYTTLNVLWSEDTFCNCNYGSWMESPACNTCLSSIEQIAYNGNTFIAFWDDGSNCSDGFSTIYNCDGTVYCQMGGIAGINTCGFLPYNYTVIETLWEYQAICNQVDLALRMTLQPGQPSSFNQGDLVTFDITVFNQGTADALIDIVNYIPQGLLLNDGDWNIVSTNTAMAQTIGPIPPQGQETIPITLYVEDNSFCSAINAAEILVANDIDSTSDTFDNNDITIDNEINNTYSDEDDYDIELIGINCQNCPRLLDLGNVNLSSGVYQASEELRSISIIDSGANVIFKASNSITLNRDFTVDKLANFSVKIEPCNCNLPAPNNFVVDNINQNDLTLQWTAISGASAYYVEYLVDGNFINRFYTTNTNLIIPFANGIDHQYTVFTDCGANSAASQGSTINYTNTPDCSTCTPPENIDAYFDDNGNLIISFDGAEGANYLNFAFYDEDGNLLLEQPYDGMDSIVVSPSSFQGSEFPDVFEVEVSANCGPRRVNFREIDDLCHTIRGILIVVQDDTGKYGDYCDYDERIYGISCSHTNGIVNLQHFQCIHCNGRNSKPLNCLSDCVTQCNLSNTCSCID